MEPVVILVSLFVTALAIYVFERYLASNRINGLPEPPGNIIFGHALKLGTSCIEKTLLDWKLTYGPAFQVRIGHLRVLVLGSKSAISECFSLPQASGRPRVGVLQSLYEELGEGPVLGEGPEYDEQRQFLVRALPTHGDGRRLLEASFQSELQELMAEWRSRGDQVVVDLDTITGAFVINSFWNVLGGKKYSEEQVRHVTVALEQILGITTLKQRLQLLFHPILLKIGLGGALEALHNVRAIVKISLDLILEHEKTRSPGNPCDMIDQMLEKRDKATDSKSAFHHNNAHQAFRLAELWAASTEIVMGTIEYLVLLMSQNPGIVACIRTETFDVIGLDEEPRACHWDRMPFSAACVIEVVRIFSAAAIGLPHKALQDFEFRGSLIPKGTLILANIWGVNHDPEVWENPQDFNPTRFLNSDGMLDFSKRSQVVSFSAGRRRCPGQQMTLDAIFLFMVTTLRHFDFESVGPVDLGYKYGGTSLAPKDGNRIRVVPLKTARVSY